MNKIINLGNESKAKLFKGIQLVYDCVISTLGVSGQGVIIDRGFLVPAATDDGVSIVNSLTGNTVQGIDDVERQGIELIAEVARKTNQEAGDGTTTSIVLAHALVSEAMKYTGSPLELRRSLELAKNKAIGLLKGMSKPLKTDKEILEVATLSASSSELGQQIADAFKSVGRDGVISIEESNLPNTQISTVEGYEVAKGFASPFMADNGKAIHDNTRILVVGSKIDNVPEIVPICEKLMAEKITQFVIFCSEMDNPVLNTILLNRNLGNFKCLVIKANSQGQEILQDVALITGAKYISNEAGSKLSEAQVSDLGFARRITATNDKTVILNGKGNPKKKIKELREQLENTKNENEYDLIEKRIARLDNKIAVISVGAKTSNEMQPKYLKMEDAVNAVKSAIEEGTVEGGGMAYYKIANMLEDTPGEQLLSKTLLAPLKAIISNADKDYAKTVMNMPKGKGYNAETNEYVDMLKAGIIDPTKVERCALENAVSFAISFIGSKGVIAFDKSSDNKVED